MSADLTGADLRGLYSSSVSEDDRKMDFRLSLNGVRLVGATGITNDVLRMMSSTTSPGVLVGANNVQLGDRSLPAVVGLSTADLRDRALAPTQRLEGFNLANAYMVGWNLDRVVLDNAALNAANLSNASLVEARLVEADLSQTELGGANLRGADLTAARFAPDVANRVSDARFDALTKLSSDVSGAALATMIYVVGADRVDPAVTVNSALIKTQLEPGGTLVIPAASLLGPGMTISGSSGTLFVPSGSLRQTGGTIHADAGEGLFLLGRFEGQGRLEGRIHVMDTLARDGRASFEQLWLAPAARLELVARDWRSGALFSGATAWLDGVLSLDFSGAGLADGDRLVVVAADTIGGAFAATEWLGLAQGTDLALEYDLSPGHMRLVLIASVTAVPEPATWALMLVGGLVVWARRRRARGHSRDGLRQTTT